VTVLQSKLAFTEYRPLTAAGEETIVLLSSLGVSRRSWSITAPVLAERRHCIAVDISGHGTSRPAPHFMTIGDFAASIGELLDELGHDRVIVVGNSMGATIGTELAVSRPELVSHLVHVGSAAWDTESARREWLHSRSAIFCRPDGSLQEMTDDFVVGIFGSYDAARHQLLKEDQGRSGPRLAWAMWALYAYDIFAALQQVSQPVLAVFGENDPYRHQTLPIMRRAVGRLQEAVLNGGGHLLPLDRGPELAAEIDAWLRTYERDH
jgi:pimeloyl-ACP methyl ester carboxylesterase